MRLIYVAGKYTSPDRWIEEQNIRAAEVLAREVMLLGAWPCCPHSNTRGYFTTSCTYEQALAGTLELMRRCDAVLFSTDWEQSRGARGEYEEAVRLGIPCFFSVEQLAAWLRGQGSGGA